MNDDPFSIDYVNIYYHGYGMLSFSGEEFFGYISGMENCEYDDGLFVPLSEDPVLYLNDSLNQKIIETWQDRTAVWDKQNSLFFAAALLVLAEAGMLLVLGKRQGKISRMTVGHLTAVIAADVILCFGISLQFGIWYLMNYFGDVQIGELLYYIQAPLDGTNVSSFYRVFWGIGGIVAGCSLVVFFCDFLLRKRRKQAGYALWLGVLGVICGVNALWAGYMYLDVADYLAYINDKSTIYEEYCADGREVELTFPEEKRNLIYIFVESMELAYADKVSGGAMVDNYIPELTELAALGVQIEGDRLGLGVNLFSNIPTLCETYGETYLNQELSKSSDYYEKQLVY